jgi:Flp pilus assembly protein CpaB
MGRVSASTRAGAPGGTTSPPAVRPSRTAWRDPRLALGLLLVCGCVLVGARVLARADETVAVLAARAPLAAGEQVSAEDLVSERLRFGSSRDADRYLPAAADLGSDTVLLRPVGAGELVPRAALGTAGDDALVELPLSLEPGRVPASVTVGSTVDVWVSSPPARGRSSAPAERLLSGVPVLAASRPSSAGTGGTAQVVVGVPVGDQRGVAEVVSRSSDGSLLLVRRPG